MDRELPHWRFFEIYEITLRSGITGIGETLTGYTWGPVHTNQAEALAGQNAISCMWDDRLGAGVQMALFDAVSRTMGVPMYRLLGRPFHEKIPVSWWCIDMPPEDLAAECRMAFDAGYLSCKIKGRPWFDIWEQLSRVSDAVPENFRLDVDFNQTLLDAKLAAPILQSLAKNPRVAIIEEPISPKDRTGLRKLRSLTQESIAMHYGRPTLKESIIEGLCDGFVLDGGVSSLLAKGRACDELGVPYWLQMVGSSITAAFSLHVASVLKNAVWPSVTCHQLYAKSLLLKEIAVAEGFARVPQEPGIGFSLNKTALAELEIPRQTERFDPPRLLETRWPDGRSLLTANDGSVNFFLSTAMQGKFPYFYEPGVTTGLLQKDSTSDWEALRERALRSPILRND